MLYYHLLILTSFEDADVENWPLAVARPKKYVEFVKYKADDGLNDKISVISPPDHGRYDDNAILCKEIVSYGVKTFTITLLGI